VTLERFAFGAGGLSIVGMLLAWVASRFGLIAPRWLMLSLAGGAFGFGVLYAIARALR
jgi:hypothetical protein